MRLKTLLCVAVCVPLMAAATGCLAAAAVGGAAAGAGAATYYVGKYEQTLNAPLDEVYDAAVAVLKGQGLQVSEERRDKVSAHLESEYADGKHVWIDMEAQPEGTTVLSVRVGLLPDKERALAILEGVKKRL